MAELTILRGDTRLSVSFVPGALLSDVLQDHGAALEHPCGGRGVCGKCAVRLSGQVSPPDEMEKLAGSRLACRAVLLGNAEVILPQAHVTEQIEMGTSRILSPLDAMEGDYGAAADIGTTTLALRLYDLHTGQCVGECGMLNPQTAVAADVIGRIGAAMNGQGAFLQSLVSAALKTMLERACTQAKAPVDQVRSFVITGNTAMLYLLTGCDPAALSHAPFQADCLFGETIRQGSRRIYLPPCMHAFVGADITCAVLSSGQCERAGVSLLCDVGTNGEIALWKNGRLLVTSTAAGPAFEGAGISCGCGSVRGAIDRVWVRDGQINVHTIGNEPPAGICGSGLIDAVACGLALEAIDETGALEEEDFPLANGIRLLPRDIRAVQLAKGAVAAGIETLLEEAEVKNEEIENLFIAGGFGSHMNPESAAAIGLFPAFLASRVRVLGNAALDGAAQMLLDRSLIRKAQGIVQLSQHVDLGGNPKFNDHYMDHMLFPPGINIGRKKSGLPDKYRRNEAIK